MFIFSDQEPDYPWPVEVLQPSQDKPGRFETQTFTAIFRADPDADLVAIARGDEMSARAFVAKIFVGFRDITNLDDEVVPDTADTRKALLAAGPVRQGLFKAYCESRIPKAQQKARAKN